MLDEGDGAWHAAQFARRLAQVCGKLLNEDRQQARLQRRVAREPVVQIERKRQDPLSKRHVRQHLVDQVRRSLGRPPRCAGRTEAAVLAAEDYGSV